MSNIEIAKQVLGADCEEYCTLVEEPPYKGYDVVACNPNEGFLGLPMYVLIKDGKGHRADGQELDDLLFRPIDDLSQTIQDYANSVKDYLINTLCVSEQIAERLVRENSAALEGYLEDKLPVSASATGLIHHLL